MGSGISRGTATHSNVRRSNEQRGTPIERTRNSATTTTLRLDAVAVPRLSRTPPALNGPQPASKHFPTCVVCRERHSDIAIDPCGHMCLCDSCFAQVQQRTNKCPICRQDIAKPIRVFIPGDDEIEHEDKSLQTSLPVVVDLSRTI